MVAKKYQNPKGGLNAAGRAFFKRKEGSNLKAPVKSGKNPRRVSFAARFASRLNSEAHMYVRLEREDFQMANVQII